MSDRRPDAVYGVLVQDGRVFLRRFEEGLGLFGGVFRPMAEDRKVELKVHLWQQLGIEATRIWAQGAFDYQGPGESAPRFCGFYTVWEWDGDLPPGAGEWLDLDGVAKADLVPPLKILLTSILNTFALRTR